MDIDWTYDGILDRLEENTYLSGLIRSEIETIFRDILCSSGVPIVSSELLSIFNINSSAFIGRDIRREAILMLYSELGDLIIKHSLNPTTGLRWFSSSFAELRGEDTASVITLFGLADSENSCLARLATTSWVQFPLCDFTPAQISATLRADYFELLGVLEQEARSIRARVSNVLSSDRELEPRQLLLFSRGG